MTLPPTEPSKPPTSAGRNFGTLKFSRGSSLPSPSPASPMPSALATLAADHVGNGYRDPLRCSSCWASNGCCQDWRGERFRLGVLPLWLLVVGAVRSGHSPAAFEQHDEPHITDHRSDGWVVGGNLRHNSRTGFNVRCTGHLPAISINLSAIAASTPPRH